MTIFYYINTFLFEQNNDKLAWEQNNNEQRIWDEDYIYSYFIGIMKWKEIKAVYLPSQMYRE